MIKIENVDVYGWEAAIRGMRNPMNSWDKSDSVFAVGKHQIGENDLELMRKLAEAGPDHGKFLRMITVTADITAPLYWVAEHDTYKVGTVRNSCSFMHKGTSRPFSINDFSVQDSRVYYLLNPLKSKVYDLVYPYETSDFRIFEVENGRKYKVFRNGRIVACEFSYTDNYGSGRSREFPEREVKPYGSRNGYFEVHLGGRAGKTWPVHRIVALLWLDNPHGYDTVNHKDGNKGNNCAENLEWVTLAENIRDGYRNGLYEENKMHRAYYAWKTGHRVVSPIEKRTVLKEHREGESTAQIAEKYGIPKKTVENMIFIKQSENSDLFMTAYIWEELIAALNKLRASYIETGDEATFKEIRQLLPQGYNVRYTWAANYAVLRNMYHARKGHKLDEWRDFCAWIETLPHADLITGGERPLGK